MVVVKDLRVGNAILRKLANENNFDSENVYLNKQFKYIETVNVNKKDADFCTTQYKGKIYKVVYLSGCFNPFITQNS